MVRKQYNLDDAQYKGIYAAELEYMTKMMALRDKGQQPAPGEGQKMNEEKDQKYKAVMTPEQYEKYSATRRPSVQPNAAPAAAPASK